MSKWKAEQPTEPGNYWWRENASVEWFDWEIINLVQHGAMLNGWRHHDDDFGWSLDALGGEWWPVPLPVPGTDPAQKRQEPK